MMKKYRNKGLPGALRSQEEAQQRHQESESQLAARRRELQDAEDQALEAAKDGRPVGDFSECRARILAAEDRHGVTGRVLSDARTAVNAAQAEERRREKQSALDALRAETHRYLDVLDSVVAGGAQRPRLPLADAAGAAGSG